MQIEVLPVPIDDIMPLRELYRQQMSCQIIMDSFASRGFSSSYLILAEGQIAGYGLVAQQHYPETIHEFYVSPGYAASALPMFSKLLDASQTKRIRAQTNDRLLLQMLYDCGTSIDADAVLFEDVFTTQLVCPDCIFRETTDADREQLRARHLDDGARWMLEWNGVPVAAGGVLGHYNPPFGDIYMGVAEAHRRWGFGSYLVQELKRVAYQTGKIPAARCNASNEASRRTLQKAGLLPCGRMLEGEVRPG